MESGWGCGCGCGVRGVGAGAGCGCRVRGGQQCALEVSLQERRLVSQATGEAGQVESSSWGRGIEDQKQPGPQFPGGGQGSWQEPTEDVSAGAREGRASGSLAAVPGSGMAQKPEPDRV